MAILIEKGRIVTATDDYFGDVFSTLHVLPCFPSSSDGGFAVIDYRTIDPTLGDWADLAAIVGDGGLMIDLVCNHGSTQSEWFEDFVADREPGRALVVDRRHDRGARGHPGRHAAAGQRTAGGVSSRDRERGGIRRARGRARGGDRLIATGRIETT